MKKGVMLLVLACLLAAPFVLAQDASAQTQAMTRALQPLYDIGKGIFFDFTNKTPDSWEFQVTYRFLFFILLFAVMYAGLQRVAHKSHLSKNIVITLAFVLSLMAVLAVPRDVFTNLATKVGGLMVGIIALVFIYLFSHFIFKTFHEVTTPNMVMRVITSFFGAFVINALSVMLVPYSKQPIYDVLMGILSIVSLFFFILAFYYILKLVFMRHKAETAFGEGWEASKEKTAQRFGAFASDVTSPFRKSTPQITPGAPQEEIKRVEQLANQEYNAIEELQNSIQNWQRNRRVP